MTSPDLSASILIRNKNNVWIDDRMASNCYNCKVEFTFMIRRHHCRYCGNIFCYSCTNRKIVIPSFIKDRPHNTNLFSYIHTHVSRDVEERVCQLCYDMIENKILLNDQIQCMLNDPPSYIEIKSSNHKSHAIKMYYFDYLRNIQYYLPNHAYSEVDRILLKKNKSYFSGHSKYLSHLIKSIDWDMSVFSFDSLFEIEVDEIMDILHPNAITTTCKDIYCTRTCKPTLQLTDCINILFSSYDSLPDKILEYMFEIMTKYNENDIYCYLSVLVQVIKSCTINKSLSPMIYALVKSSPILLNSIYWLLTAEKETAESHETNNINKFLSLWDTSMITRIHTNYAFYQGLSLNLNEAQKYLASNFSIYKPIYLPFKPNVQIVDIDFDSIVIKNSYTKPVIITFITSNGQRLRIMFKNENVMNDHIVLNLINLTDTVLHDNISESYEMVLYHVLPITSQSGLIEIVENAETIHSINLSGQCILQYIMKHNEDKIIHEVLDRYTYSLVCYTLHSYFLGVGDRHLENIMITTDGRIFHIDFGFILGRDSHPISSSDIKINTGMLDVVYGVKSQRYLKYKQLCSQAVVLIRKHFSDYYILLSQLRTAPIGRGAVFIESFVNNRFQLRQSDDKIKEELNALIERSQRIYMENVRDFLHYHTKERTVQTGLNNILSIGYDLFAQSLKSSFLD
jgi:hypothetical protein